MWTDLSRIFYLSSSRIKYNVIQRRKARDSGFKDSFSCRHASNTTQKWRRLFQKHSVFAYNRIRFTIDYVLVKFLYPVNFLRTHVSRSIVFQNVPSQQQSFT